MNIRMQVSLHNIPNSCTTVCGYQQPLARDNICLRPVLPTYEVQLINKKNVRVILNSDPKYLGHAGHFSLCVISLVSQF